MKTQLAIVAGVLLSLGTAFSETRTEAPTAQQPAVLQSASADVSSRATAQVVSLWKDHSKSIGSTHLARPL